MTKKERKKHLIKVWRAKNKDRIKEVTKKYREAHKETARIYQIKYAIEHKAQLQAYRKNRYLNRTLTQKLQKSKRNREYRKMNKVYCKERDRKYHLNHMEQYRLNKRRRRALRTAAGDLPISRIQMVYEDNIKKYGTLTCIYCLKPIKFGDDHLEHKQPLARKGTNEYENLAVACSHDNSSKRHKTEAEYRVYLSELRC